MNRYSQRAGLICSITALICTCSLASANNNDEQLLAQANSKVVMAKRDLGEGALIQAGDVYERELEFSKTPQDAISQAAFAVGKIAKYGIYKDYIISQHDLMPPYNYHSVRIVLSDAQNKKLIDLAAQQRKNAADIVKGWIVEKLGK